MNAWFATREILILHNFLKPFLKIEHSLNLHMDWRLQRHKQRCILQRCVCTVGYRPYMVTLKRNSQKVRSNIFTLNSENSDPLWQTSKCLETEEKGMCCWNSMYVDRKSFYLFESTTFLTLFLSLSPEVSKVGGENYISHWVGNLTLIPNWLMILFT